MRMSFVLYNCKDSVPVDNVDCWAQQWISRGTLSPMVAVVV
jgi:hypothetical protein